MHKVLVNRLGGLSLPRKRKSVVRLIDHPDMVKQQHNNNNSLVFSILTLSVLSSPMMFFPIQTIIISNSENLPYFFSYKMKFFSFQKHPKDLDQSYKMDLDLWDC